jgi:hypothetical protein
MLVSEREVMRGEKRVRMMVWLGWVGLGLKYLFN